MRKEETDRSHRQRDGADQLKREGRKDGDSRHVNKSYSQMNHDRKVAGHKHHHRNKEEAVGCSTDRDHYHHRSNSRREWRSRNSPVEITGRRQNMDGSSSSSETDLEQSQGIVKRNRKREHEESFEELSRRKKRIESELNALDAEEAEEQGKQTERKRPKSNRNRRMNEHRRKHAPDHQEERPVRIKEEPLSDDEASRRRRPSGDRRRRQQNLDAQEEGGEWGKPEQKEAKPKEKPNFETSGKLAEDTNTFNGVVIKYNEPSEARKPKRRWRLYPFKGEVSLPFIPVHRQSAYLLGRTRLIADIPIDHPSCSKQHAVLQFRLLPYERDDGTKGRSVRPYIIDLDSSNGTFVNNKKIEPRRYYELFEKDVLKFGFSTRVYVILHEDSKNENDEGGES